MVVYVKKNIIHLENIDSTNNYAKKLGNEGYPHKTVVVADKQTGGKGRLGRFFFSPEGGLYMSILLRPENNCYDFLITTAAASVAVVRAIKKVCNIDCEIKWVNDIYKDGKKICGILTEGVFDTANNMLSFAVLGIGLNIFSPNGGFPEEISEIAGSVYNSVFISDDIKNNILNNIITEFFYIFDNPEDTDFLNEYREKSLILGKEIYYIFENEKHYCTAVDIDQRAQLIVLENGVKKTIGSGEVTIRKAEKKFEK